jgi:hypothetical protein
VKRLIKGILASSMLFAPLAMAEVVSDLGDWVVEDADTADAIWTYDENENSWYQTVNTGDMTILYDPSGESLGKAITGTISVQTTSDDDYIGFVVGYNPGDKNIDDAGYMLLSWKQSQQSNLDIGMELFYAEEPLSLSYLYSGGKTGVVASNDYESVGWQDFVEYSFDIAYSESYLAIYVNDELQYSVTPGDAGIESFEEGSFGFYNFSQSNVLFGGVVYDDIETVISEEKLEEIASAVPLSGTAGFAMALIGALSIRRGRR